jgi:hypothetical protein
MLTRLSELGDKLLMYLEFQEQSSFRAFKKNEWMLPLTYLSDTFSHLNGLNASLKDVV